MKTKISISLDEETLALLEAEVEKSPEFRSKSHLIELAIRKQLEAEEKDD